MFYLLGEWFLQGHLQFVSCLVIYSFMESRCGICVISHTFMWFIAFKLFRNEWIAQPWIHYKILTSALPRKIIALSYALHSSILRSCKGRKRKQNYVHILVMFISEQSPRETWLLKLIFISHGITMNTNFEFRTMLMQLTYCF